LPSASEARAARLERLPSPAGHAVEIENLSVTYRTTFEKKPTLKRTLLRLGRRQRMVREIPAVRGVTLEVPHGSVLGIVGVNGAGKSTLMRTVAGILPPNEGRVVVYGRVSTLLALGVGFNRDLTGRDNVVLGGLAAGLSREQLEARFDRIAEFAELADVIELPVRSYSSGMYGRLAISVAMNTDPDILLIDEALSVGDARFKRKCFERMRELSAQGRTILIVSHALKSLGELCDEVVWMHKGQLAMRDEPETVIAAYTRFLDVGETDIALEDV
jgi:ABC-type polysaccharide/polyol phosphate transport system ATPase subunit